LEQNLFFKQFTDRVDLELVSQLAVAAGVTMGLRPSWGSMFLGQRVSADLGLSDEVFGKWTEPLCSV